MNLTGSHSIYGLAVELNRETVKSNARQGNPTARLRPSEAGRVKALGMRSGRGALSLGLEWDKVGHGPRGLSQSIRAWRYEVA